MQTDNSMATILFRGGTKCNLNVSGEAFTKLLSGDFGQKPDPLADISYDRILKAFSNAYRIMAKAGHPLYHQLRHFGLSYFLNFIHSGNLKKQLENAIGYDVSVCSCRIMPDRREIYYLPRGTAGHWLAGNVPILGLISVTLAVLTRNRSVIKLPASGPDHISDFLLTFTDKKMGDLLPVGKKIADACTVTRFSGDSIELNQAMASVCDLRIVWGSETAVESVRNLRSGRPGYETVRFGHRVSASVADPCCMTDKDYEAAAKDSVLFNQNACTSPHWIFVKGTNSACRDFGSSLAKALEKIEDKPFFTLSDAHSAIKVLEFRTRCLLENTNIIASKGTQWTIHFCEPEKPFSAYGHRVIGIKSFSSISEIMNYLPANIQSITHKLLQHDTEELARLAAMTGIDRLPALGHAHDFELPWDGHNVIDRLTRKLVVWPTLINNQNLKNEKEENHETVYIGSR